MTTPEPDNAPPAEFSADPPDLSDTGGDPVCWAPRVCPECGLFVPGEPPTVCPRCGTAVGVD